MDRRIIILLIIPVICWSNNLGDYYAEKGYFFEAITEYKRELFLSDSTNRDELQYKISKLYYRAGKNKMAEKYALEVVFNEDKTELDNSSLILIAKIHWDNYNYTAFRNTLDFLNQKTDSIFKQELKYIKAWSYYYDAEWEQGNQLIKSLDYNFKKYLLQDIRAVEKVPQKSKTFALITSGIIPGTGQLYAGDYENAAFSFLLVGSIGGSIVWNVIKKAYGVALAKYLFLFTRYHRGGLKNLGHKIDQDNISRIGDYLHRISQKYPDPIEKLENLKIKPMK